MMKRGAGSAAEIERALVARHGASIVAVPADRDPRGPLSWALVGLLALSAMAPALAALVASRELLTKRLPGVPSSAIKNSRAGPRRA